MQKVSIGPQKYDFAIHHPEYGFLMFVKRNIIVVSLRTQVLVKKLHKNLARKK